MTTKNITTKGPTNQNIFVQTKRAGNALDRRTIKRRAARALTILDVNSAELSILLCDDVFIQKLNRDYRNKDKPTDVLSFPLHDADDPPVVPLMLGDVVISVETAAVQAQERGHSILDEGTELLVHGILHLLGYDHETDEDEKKMNELSQQLCIKLK